MTIDTSYQSSAVSKTEKIRSSVCKKCLWHLSQIFMFVSSPVAADTHVTPEIVLQIFYSQLRSIRTNILKKSRVYIKEAKFLFMFKGLFYAFLNLCFVLSPTTIFKSHEKLLMKVLIYSWRKFYCCQFFLHGMSKQTNQWELKVGFEEEEFSVEHLNQLQSDRSRHNWTEIILAFTFTITVVLIFILWVCNYL